MSENCTDCPYNIDNYCIMFDDVLGFEDCVFKKEGADDQMMETILFFDEVALAIILLLLLGFFAWLYFYINQERLSYVRYGYLRTV